MQTKYVIYCGVVLYLGRHNAKFGAPRNFRDTAGRWRWWTL